MNNMQFSNIEISGAPYAVEVKVGLMVEEGVGPFS
jgi:hypothetical protein